MPTRFRTNKLRGGTLFLLALPLFLASLRTLAVPFHGSLYTPVREHQAIGPLPPEPIAYYPYTPKTVLRLEDLPAAIRAKAIATVRERVGESFFQHLRFVGGEAVNLGELHRVNPESRKFSSEVPAYDLHWEFAMPEAGIRNYTASLSLRKNGSVLRGLDLPSVATDPSKLQLVPLRQTSQDLIDKNLLDAATATATVTYDQKGDRFVWHFEQPLPGEDAEVKIRSLDVDAHTGAIIGQD